jgi:prepilin-type N-terminal cleavage/methylation domain-containing protein
MKKRKISAFSLVELLLVMAILSVVGITVYTTMVNGINIWQRIVVETSAEDVGIFLERLSGELRNTFLLTGIKFRGGRDSVSFPGRIRLTTKDGAATGIGEVRYAFDRRDKLISRGYKTYSQLYRNRGEQERPIAENIESLDFEYYFYEPERKKYSWSSGWQEHDETFGLQEEPALPLAIRIKVGIEEPEGKKVFTKTVWIPSGCCAGPTQ